MEKYLNLSGLEHLTDMFASKMMMRIYPVGSVYISASSTNPADLFGFGTWEQISGRFLFAADDAHPAGSMGGEAEHTLTIDEMPIHNHHFEALEGGTGLPTVPTWPESKNPSTSSDWWHVTWASEEELSDDFYPYTNWINAISYSGGGAIP